MLTSLTRVDGSYSWLISEIFSNYPLFCFLFCRTFTDVLEPTVLLFRGTPLLHQVRHITTVKTTVVVHAPRHGQTLKEFLGFLALIILKIVAFFFPYDEHDMWCLPQPSFSSKKREQKQRLLSSSTQIAKWPWFKSSKRFENHSIFGTKRRLQVL